ncbi:hypothetical protein BGX38DRAFT_1258690 [Terfezia claveryi]|nr:hypothetical protein BGX38DRAFT_1258690 [Terfezia claveryi]
MSELLTIGTTCNVHETWQPPIGFQDQVANKAGIHAPQRGLTLATPRVLSGDDYLEGKPRLAALMARRKNNKSRDVTSEPVCASQVPNSDLKRPQPPPNAQGATNPRGPFIGQFPLASPLSKQCAEGDTENGMSDRGRCFDAPSAASPELSLYAYRNGEPSALSSSARQGHRLRAWAAGDRSPIHPESPQETLSSSKPVCIGSFRPSKATFKMDIPSLLNDSPDSDPKAPRSLDGAAGPRQLKP